MVKVKRPKGETRWQVRWDEWETILLEGGGTEKRRRQRGRFFDRKQDADDLALKIGLAHGMGERYDEAADRPVDTLETLTNAYIDARKKLVADDTLRTDISFLSGFMRWAGPGLVVSRLDRALLERYRDTLPTGGRRTKTAQRKLMAVEAMWDWGDEHDDQIKGVPKPRRASDTLRTPPQITAAANPMIADVDKALAHLTNRPWHRQVGLLLRYTGMRVGQAVGLRWSDVDLENGYLTLRISLRGSKKTKTRTLPIHSALQTEMRTWPRTGLTVVCKPDGTPWRSDATLEPMRLAWEHSGVDRAVWDKVDEENARDDDRANGRPNHVFRAAVRTELTSRGETDADCDLLLGHGKGFIETYVSNRFSPKMAELKRIIELIPAHTPMSATPGRTVRPKAAPHAKAPATAAVKAQNTATAAAKSKPRRVKGGDGSPPK